MPWTSGHWYFVLWGTVGLVEIVLAALLGGWIYREGPGAGAAAETATG